MNPIELELPEETAVVFNALYPTKEASYLTDDLFLAKLPGDVFIDVGWFPENDPTGRYVLRVYRKKFENEIEPPFENGDIHAIARRIEQVAEKYKASRPAVKRVAVTR